MKVILAKSAGFCRGVRRAVNKAREIATSKHSTETQPVVFSDGPLMHNKQMMDQLRSEGITEAADPSTIPADSDSTLLIRAHGIPPSHRAEINELPLTIVDATCPDVARIQGLIKKHATKGYSTIIYGDDGHAEVIGLMGFTAKRGYAVSKPEDVDALPDMVDVCLVSQSTQFPASYKDIISAVKAKYSNAVVLDTICESTKDRQNEVVDIARSSDCIIVVGGSHSANTLRLVELASTLKPTFHIQTAEQLISDDFRNFETAGLTAGASTPSFIIDDVKKRLEEI